MVDFRPFRGIRYETSIAGPLDGLVCPPYDVISPGQELQLLERSRYNVVRLELAELTGPPDPDRYTAAAGRYRQWLADGILRRDDAPSYYLVRQRFPHGLGTLERYSVTGALRLEEWGTGVLPHEHTGAAAKADRMSLIEECAANFSPLMGLFRDEDGLLQRLRDWAAAHPPEAQFRGPDGHQYTSWQVADGQMIAAIGQALASQPVFVADGHHRYETALNYWVRHQGEAPVTTAAAGYVMMSLVALDDPGLLIMPYHRVVGHLPPELFTQVRDRIAQVFIIRPVAVDTSTPGPLETLVAQESQDRPVMGLLGPSGEGPYVLTAGDSPLMDRYTPPGPEASLREVEAWLLQEVVLRPILGEGFANHLTYVHEGQQALEMVQGGGAQLAFFLKGIPPQLFQRLVGAGIRLPRKSTYFHPKLLSGLVINPLDGSL